MKIPILLLLLFSLSACQKASTEQTEKTSVLASNEPEIQETSLERGQVESQPLKNDGTRQAWTDYSAYAQVDEEGYAYYMQENPDISSEIFPLYETGDHKVLLFTFDDAPQRPDSYALEIAQQLKVKDVNAIFLVNGMYLTEERGRQITKQIYDMGFEIGNHTQHHPNLKEMTYDQQYQEIKQTSDLVEEITGEKPRWFRPPFGLFNMDTYRICQDLEMQLMTWNFGYDWMEDYLDGDALLEISLNNDYLRAGANILMHDRPWTNAAISRMVDGYREQGYHIVDPLLIRNPDFEKES
ncbi:polysaccharide deacetylase family protein [Facklamia miroungae]|uniref:Peptidoglycan/xylan/chitin deacetylase, PgdA/CDA1 family n=1 Tax=Facklamia miroungae TaxID=120956 RepID=A0A1G7U5F4_9LACT|nr:polysaccharide deacetylase family protein [Facklamia miroungae]NKZ29922.1 polysaccharide deacetylase family protein [Facklamia miroungae]SDG42796.1 Peptidoglycan/xylan/chitin deacetylase, PgdA/CDA1 family [Facklamia miroungae]